jgi:hypothetical protein
MGCRAAGQSDADMTIEFYFASNQIKENALEKWLGFWQSARGTADHFRSCINQSIISHLWRSTGAVARRYDVPCKRSNLPA